MTGVSCEHKVVLVYVEPVLPERGCLKIGVEYRRLALGLIVLIHGVVAVYLRTVGGLENVSLREEIKLLFEFVLERIHQESDIFSNDSDSYMTIILNGKRNIQASTTTPKGVREDVRIPECLVLQRVGEEVGIPRLWILRGSHRLRRCDIVVLILSVNLSR